MEQNNIKVPPKKKKKQGTFIVWNYNSAGDDLLLTTAEPRTSSIGIQNCICLSISRTLMQPLKNSRMRNIPNVSRLTRCTLVVDEIVNYAFFKLVAIHFTHRNLPPLTDTICYKWIV